MYLEWSKGKKFPLKLLCNVIILSIFDKFTKGTSVLLLKENLCTEVVIFGGAISFWLREDCVNHFDPKYSTWQRQKMRAMSKHSASKVKNNHFQYSHAYFCYAYLFNQMCFVNYYLYQHFPKNVNYLSREMTFFLFAKVCMHFKSSHSIWQDDSHIENTSVSNRIQVLREVWNQIIVLYLI